MRYQRPGLPPPRGSQTAVLRGPQRRPSPFPPGMPVRARPGLAGVGNFGDAATMTGPNVLGNGAATVYVPGAAGSQGMALDANDSRVQDMSFAARTEALGYQDWIPQTGIEDNQGDPYFLDPAMSDEMRTPMSPGVDTQGFVNPFRTVMYSITGLSTTIPTRVLTGNLKRTYLIIQNLGPGNMFVGIGTDPNSGGTNVMNLVGSQIYEQVGGGFFVPPNPFFPDGFSFANSFVSPEYISLMVDTAGTNAMVLEGTWSPPRPGSHG